MKYELEQKCSVSEDFYLKAKVLVLISTMSWTDMDGKTDHKAHFFVTHGEMKKCPSFIHHYMDIAIRSAKRSGGVTTIVHTSDGCRAEFSNGTHLLHCCTLPARSRSITWMPNVSNPWNMKARARTIRWAWS